MDKVLLDYGSGGRASHRFVADLFFNYLGNDILARMDDAAVLSLTGPVAMSTDSFVVDPIFFPGGDIGSLAVHGTVNDVAMMGARPLFLTCGFILEEGLPMDDLAKIVASMGQAARDAGVRVVAGDTKVVPRGAADKIFINTTGIGEIMVDPAPSGHRAAIGDVVIVSGSMGDHGLAILSTREGLSFEAPVVSDSASLAGIVGKLLAAVPGVHVLRDPTRGGLATTLNEIAGQSNVGIELTQADIPIHPAVAGGCAVLGLDPLYLANEGKFLCIVPEDQAQAALAAITADPLGAGAKVVGRVTADHPGKVALVTPLGGKRLLGMLEGEQLPRIC